MSNTRASHVVQVPWKTGDVLLALVLVVAGSLALVLAVAGATDRLGSRSLAIGLLAVGVASVLMLMVSWGLGPRRYRVSIRYLGLRTPTPLDPSQLMLPLLILVTSLIMTGVYSAIISILEWEILQPPELPVDSNLSGGALVLAAIVVIALAPLAEEVFFRGFVFPGLARRLGLVGAVVVSSFLFALAHGTIALLVPAFLSGVLLAWLYRRTGSLMGCFMAHGGQNALVFAVAVAG